MSGRHRRAKAEAREIRRIFLRCAYTEMTVDMGIPPIALVSGPGTDDAVVIPRDTAGYLLAQGARREETS